MSTWKEFNRFNKHNDEPFWGCVDKEGVWFDSSNTFGIAVHWCCCYYGEFELSTEQELEWLEIEGKQLGVSIIHSDMLKQMHEKGLLK